MNRCAREDHKRPRRSKPSKQWLLGAPTSSAVLCGLFEVARGRAEVGDDGVAALVMALDVFGGIPHFSNDPLTCCCSGRTIAVPQSQHPSLNLTATAQDCLNLGHH